MIATPSGSLPAKLSGEDLDVRGMDRGTYREVYPGVGEFWVPVEPARRLLEVQPLAALFVLQALPDMESSGNEVRVCRHTGATAFSLLMGTPRGSGRWRLA